MDDSPPLFLQNRSNLKEAFYQIEVERRKLAGVLEDFRKMPERSRLEQEVEGFLKIYENSKSNAENSDESLNSSKTHEEKLQELQEFSEILEQISKRLVKMRTSLEKGSEVRFESQQSLRIIQALINPRKRALEQEKTKKIKKSRKNLRFTIIGWSLMNDCEDGRRVVSRQLKSLGIKIEPNEVGYPPDQRMTSYVTTLPYRFTFELNEEKTEQLLGFFDGEKCDLTRFVKKLHYKDLRLWKELNERDIIQMNVMSIAPAYLRDVFPPQNGYSIEVDKDVLNITKNRKLVKKITMKVLILEFKDVFESTICHLEHGARRRMKKHAIYVKNAWTLE